MSTTNSAAGPAAPTLLQGSISASAESASSLEGSVRRWTITTTDGQKHSGPLGSWAEEDPSETDVPPESLTRHLEDLTLWAAFPGTSIAVQSKAFEDWETPVEYPVMRASLDCYPYEEDPARRVPLLNIELAPECSVIDLDPDRLAAFLAAMRAQLDLLEQVAGKALVEAREEWERIREDT
ncbi:DUF6907 domain-containing protein [Actinacidiphila guanduensis]|uniref:Uncharacterized protein n=1 Tax=Actinacidiphila guanduensis TaxID=310781 RepID=A0A1G9Y9M5_9ACTN|nr:hypothetical protein [Actinacidiphila guanduensis]SDN05747.1 hypothetical protein SAMN05216259_102464 [Actinacidiphila guanduensis]